MPESYTPLVSVITPTFNHEKYIGPCIESVLKQTYQNWEQIIIDDGSTDATAEMIGHYRDPRIRHVRQQNRGALELAHTYNRALSLAKGELIAILEGDDFWPGNKLVNLVARFVDPEVVLAYGEAADVTVEGNMQGGSGSTDRLRRALPASVLCNDPIGSATRYMLLAQGTVLIGPCTAVIRRRTLEEIGGFQFVEGLPLTDYPTFLELSLCGRFYYTSETMGYRRRHLKSITVLHAENINEHVANFSLAFLETHREKAFLAALERGEVERTWEESRFNVKFLQGRLFLIQKRWSKARAQFKEAFGSRRLKVRLATSIGYVFSWFHFDVEGLMRLCGRSDLREP